MEDIDALAANSDEMNSQQFEKYKNLNNMMAHKQSLEAAHENTLSFAVSDIGEEMKKKLEDEVLGKGGRGKEFTIDELEDTRRLKIMKPDERALVGPNAVHDNPALKNEYYLSVNSKAGLGNIDH